MTTKDTNPKDSIGFNKSPMFSYLSRPVLAEVGLALMEGGQAKKNGPEFVIFECGNGKSIIAPKRRLIGGIKHELATIA